ncbi:hypothetical protein D3C73_1401390 [compost metagenome]
MDLVRRFLQELDPEPGHAQADKVLQVFRSGLFDGIVHGVAAAVIHPDGMGEADPVLEGYPVLLAGTAAVGVIRTIA